jgi:hypothetical protein
MPESQTNEKFDRPFTVGLRADDPRIYSVVEKQSNLLGATVTGGTQGSHVRDYPLGPVAGIHERSYPNTRLALGRTTRARGTALRGLTPTSPLVIPDYSVSPARFIRKSDGAPILLRGVNAFAKSSTNTQQKVADLGCNFVRLAIHWDEGEPTAPTGSGTNWASYVHSFSSTYLDACEQFVRYLAGLTVKGMPVMCMIDSHQAGWSTYFGSTSHGIAPWYYSDSRFRAHQNGGSGWNTTSDQSSAVAAWWTTEAAMSQAMYGAWWNELVKRFSQYPNVILYEVFNEPNSGNMGGSYATREHTIHTWLNVIVNQIHALDAERGKAVMCLGGGQGYGSVDLAPFGSQAQRQAKNMVLEHHSYYTGKNPGYPAVGSGDVGYDSSGDAYYPDSASVHNTTAGSNYVGNQTAQDNWYSVPRAAAVRVGLPLFEGEWGVHNDDTGRMQYLSDVEAVFDNRGLSGTYWLLASGSGETLNLISSGNLTDVGVQLEGWFKATTFVGATPTGGGGGGGGPTPSGPTGGGGGGGGTVGVLSPMHYRAYDLAGTGITSLDILNSGAKDTYPVTELHGPMSNPVYRNLTTGELLQWSGLTLNAGQFIRIDHDAGVILFNGVGGQYLKGLDVVNSDFWALAPGVNTLSLIPASAGAGASAIIYWRDAVM